MDGRHTTESGLRLAHSPTRFGAQWESMKLYAAELDFSDVAREFQVEREFPPNLVEEARSARDQFAAHRRDLRDIDFVTIDPVGSKDLDQAVYITEKGDCLEVWYAIADVGAFVRPGMGLYDEALRRGQTIYLPDEPARLYPPELSEGSASLLPGVDRPAVCWRMLVDAAGDVQEYDLSRATVRSRAQLDYVNAHHPSIDLLPRLGSLRRASSLRRKAVNLSLPDTRVHRLDDGKFELILEPRNQAMDDNSEVSLMAGMVAGAMMAEWGHGYLRTLHPAPEEALEAFATELASLGLTFDPRSEVGVFLASVDPTTVTGMAVHKEAAKLLRGADYLFLDTKPAVIHAGVGGMYAHVTAPLRRLVDRYATEYCLARAEGRAPESWAREDAEAVIDTMRHTSQHANTVDNACIRLTEATVLQPWVGTTFDALVLKTNEEKNTAKIMLSQPPIISTDLVGSPAEGDTTPVTLVTADPAEREIAFAWPAD